MKLKKFISLIFPVFLTTIAISFINIDSSPDYDSYLNSLNDIWGSRYEIGFKYVVYIFSFITGLNLDMYDVHFVYLLLCIFVSSGLIYVCLKMSNYNFFLTFFIFVNSILGQSFIQLRSGFALFIISFGFYKFLQKKISKLQLIGFEFFGILIHPVNIFWSLSFRISGFITDYLNLFYYILKNKKIKIPIVFILTIGLVYYLNNFVQINNGIIDVFFNNKTVNYYSGYLTEDDYLNRSSLNIFYPIIRSIIIIIPGIFLLQSKNFDFSKSFSNLNFKSLDKYNIHYFYFSIIYLISYLSIFLFPWLVRALSPSNIFLDLFLFSNCSLIKWPFKEFSYLYNSIRILFFISVLLLRFQYYITILKFS